MQLINLEMFTNIQKAQAGISRLFEKAKEERGFYRVMRNDEPLGVLVPNNVWENLVEDIEALSSPKYLERIRQSRKDTKRLSLDKVKKMVGA